MLVRTQVLLDDKAKLELQELLQYFPEMSFSEAIRKGHSMVIKDIKKKKPKKKKSVIDLQYEAVDRWIKGAVHGPGNSEYDKYAYDL